MSTKARKRFVRSDAKSSVKKCKELYAFYESFGNGAMLMDESILMLFIVNLAGMNIPKAKVLLSKFIALGRDVKMQEGSASRILEEAVLDWTTSSDEEFLFIANSMRDTVVAEMAKWECDVTSD